MRRRRSAGRTSAPAIRRREVNKLSWTGAARRRRTIVQVGVVAHTVESPHLGFVGSSEVPA